jgi:hypothetical protein
MFHTPEDCAAGEPERERRVRKDGQRFLANVTLRITRARYWPWLEKVEARRTLNRLESLLGRVQAFARARGIQLQPAASEGKSLRVAA